MQLTSSDKASEDPRQNPPLSDQRDQPSAGRLDASAVASQPKATRAFSLPSPKLIDLHTHSSASTKVGEAMLDVIACPESFSPPLEVYRQAKLRGMDFVTLTDHDTLAGVLTIADRADVLVGEELTCYFPEDQCKIHLLVYGITPQQHDDLQAREADIYEVARYVEENQIAHSVAHPVYRQNELLERWHLERLLLLFKGFECLNGAHSPTHVDAFQPVLDRLTRAEIQRLSEVHSILPRWNEPWFKARTGGSDDHGLLNVGRTWTEFPTEVKTVSDILVCLREGTCRPGGQAGSTLKLAHTFYSVGVRYNAQLHKDTKSKSGLTLDLLQAIVGAKKAPSKARLIRGIVKSKIGKLVSKLPLPGRRKSGRQTDVLLREQFMKSVTTRLKDFPDLIKTLGSGVPMLGEHERVFELISGINRDVINGIFDHGVSRAVKGDLLGVCDSVSAALAQQFILSPYYFSLFHQNKERHLLRKITRMEKAPTEKTLKVGLFTDTFDDINGVGRFIRDMGEQANNAGYNLTIHTSSAKQRFELSNRKNFTPMLARPMPYYQTIDFSIPPVLEMLEFADRQQYDVIHVSTPGLVGMVGFLASKMLRVPMLTTYHTDFPAYVDELTGDYRMTSITSAFMGWFYKRAHSVFSRSGAYHFNLREMGVKEKALKTIYAGINTDKFNPKHRDEFVWSSYSVDKPFKLLYVGRISTEKNLPLLVEAFKRICKKRNDAQLIIAGEGPYEEKMKAELAGLPVTFTGPRNDKQLGPLYATADLFLFPSRTDTLGQVVMEAQASGVPTLVAPEGGPREVIEPDVSGLVLSGTDAQTWADAVDALLSDPVRRANMASAALTRSKRFDLRRTFESFWTEHLTAVTPEPHEEIAPAPITRNRVAVT